MKITKAKKALSALTIAICLSSLFNLNVKACEEEKTKSREYNYENTECYHIPEQTPEALPPIPDPGTINGHRCVPPVDDEEVEICTNHNHDYIIYNGQIVPIPGPINGHDCTAFYPVIEDYPFIPDPGTINGHRCIPPIDDNEVIIGTNYNYVIYNGQLVPIPGPINGQGCCPIPVPPIPGPINGHDCCPIPVPPIPGPINGHDCCPIDDGYAGYNYEDNELEFGGYAGSNYEEEFELTKTPRTR